MTARQQAEPTIVVEVIVFDWAQAQNIERRVLDAGLACSCIWAGWMRYQIDIEGEWDALDALIGHETLPTLVWRKMQ